MFGLTVKLAQGVSNDLLRKKKRYNAFLGTSLGKHLFSKENIRKYFDWADVYCNRFLLVIDDYEERLNYMVFKRLSAFEAIERVKEIGNNLKKAFIEVLPADRTEGRFRVIQARQLFALPTFQNILFHLIETYQRDKTFREDTQHQVFTNIKGKIEAWKPEVAEAEYHKGIDMLSQFLLEEIAVSMYLREIEGYQTEVYPAAPMRLVENIYDNYYPGLTTSLQIKKESYGYVYLDVDEEAPILQPKNNSLRSPSPDLAFNAVQ